MSSGVYCVEDWGCRSRIRATGRRQALHGARGEERRDWARLKPLDPRRGPRSGASWRRCGSSARAARDDAPILHTVFSPLTIASKLAGDRLLEDLAAAPDAVARRSR